MTKDRYYEVITETVSSSSTTHYTAGDWEILQDYYKENLGNRMPAAVRRLIERMESAGMTVDVVLHAIDVTMFAPRPTPYYLTAVLTRWAGDKLWTMVKVLADEEQHRARNARRFEQRYNFSETEI